MRMDGMKTLPLLSIVAVCSSSAALAQVESGNRPLAAEQPATVGTARPTKTMLAPNLPDGFTVMNGFVYSIRAGVMAPLEAELVVRVSPNGTITGFDGRTYSLPQGRVLTLFATATPIPAGTGNATGAAQAAAPGANALPGNTPATAGASGANVGGTGFNSGTNVSTDYPFFVVPMGANGFPIKAGPGTGIAPATGINPTNPVTGNPQAPTAAPGQNAPNPTNPATQPPNPGGNGTQQNTPGTQQIPPGKDNPATGNAPGTAPGKTNNGGNTAPGNAGGTTPGGSGTTGGGAGAGGGGARK